jgi:hypothetical protein
MELTMIRYGFLAGVAYLVTMYVLQWLTAPPYWDGPVSVIAPARTDPDITNQVFDLLAEARRITEEG